MSNMNPNPFQPATSQNQTVPVQPSAVPVAPQQSTPVPVPVAPQQSSSVPAAPQQPSSVPVAPQQSSTAPTAPQRPTSNPTAQQHVASTPKDRPQVYTTQKPNFACPFCLENINTNDLLYYCKVCNDTYTEKEAIDKGLFRKIGKQYFCHGAAITGNRICPNCEINAINNNVGLELLRMIPTELYERKSEFRLCMTGYSSSGKTQYITQLINYISTQMTPSVSNTRFIDHKTQEIRDAIRKKFFEEGQIAGTPRGYLDPLLYDIDSRRKSHKSVFYDIAGEDFSKEPDDLQHILVQKCAWTARNIILIIDPTTLEGVRYEPDIASFRAVPAQAADCDIADPLNSYISLVIKNNPDKEKFLKRVNIAVVFTKMDLFDNDPDLHQLVKNESTHLQNGKFNIREIEDVHREMCDWINKKKGSLLLGALKNYPNAKIFGVSSGSEDIAAKRRTNRLLDPYLWLLYKNGILD